MAFSFSDRPNRGRYELAKGFIGRGWHTIIGQIASGCHSWQSGDVPHDGNVNGPRADVLGLPRGKSTSVKPHGHTEYRAQMIPSTRICCADHYYCLKCPYTSSVY